MPAKPRSRFPGLWLKMTGAFLIVALVGIGLVALLALRVTSSEFRHTMIRGQLVGAEDLATELEAYYGSTGSWAGAAEILGHSQDQGQGQGQGRGTGRSAGPGTGQGQLYLVDRSGQIVAGVDDGAAAAPANAEALAGGIALEVNGRRVGTLINSNAWTEALSQIESDYLDQISRALLWGGLGAVGAALAIGTFLAWRIATPVRTLTRAAEDIAAGDLTGRVPVTGGDEIGYLGAAFNRMADHLARSDDLRRRMTADIAHELRTPLSIIRGQVEAIQDGLFPADEEHLAPIHDETLLLTRLVDDLRTLALADAGELPLQLAICDPSELLSRAALKFAPLAAGKGVELIVDAPGGLPVVHLDPDRIEQVLGNLLANAIRHTPAGGRVSVVVRADAELIATVSDSGPGIPKADHPHLFERFWRGDRSRARDRGGAGLGLAIARRLIEAHGGRIWAEQPLGGGAAFVVALPLGGPIE